MISIFDLFKIGIGPSSSHTIGPMKAARSYVGSLSERGRVSDVRRIEVRLFGSLAWTGKGHATDKAVILGLAGELPATIDPDKADQLFNDIRTAKRLKLNAHEIDFDPATDVVFDTLTPVTGHPNTMTFIATDADGGEILSETWLSVGG
eukprot:gene32709-37795_t